MPKILNFKNMEFNTIKIFSKKFLNNFVFDLKQYELCVLNQFDRTLITKEDLLLIDCENDSLQNELEQESITYDFIEHWIFPNITMELLRKLGCIDYTDINGNRILYSSKTPNFCVVRAMSKGKIVTTNSFCRLMNFISISGKVNIGLSGNRAYVRIGNKTTLKGLSIDCGEKGAVVIGDDCQFATNIELRENDGHMIFDSKSLQRINYNKDIIVGNHVWLGKNVILLGGATIPDGCVVGMASVTSRSFKEKNCIIAGSPAKIIRNNIIWSRDVTSPSRDLFTECEDRNALFYLE